MSKSNDVSARDPVAVQKKQRMLMWGGLGGLLLVIFLLMATSEQDGPVVDTTKAEDAKEIRTSGESVTDAEIWIAQSEAQMAEMRDQMKEMRQLIDQTNRENEALKRELGDFAERDGLSSMDGTDPFAGASSVIQVPPPPPPGQPSQTQNQVRMPEPPSNGADASVRMQSQPQPPRNGIARVSLVEDKSLSDRRAERSASGENDEADQEGEEEGEKRPHVDSYIPAGSFVQGDILGGIDAPTGNSSQGDPHPMLVRLNDKAFLPNRYRSDVDECHVIGAGYGDLSSERAYVRVENLSCVMRDGSVLDTAVDAYIVGEDGKTGVRGRLVSKQGQFIGKALLAGIVGGIGEGFRDASSTITTTTAGTTNQTIDAGNIGRYGAASGVGSAMERLADYYIEAAEKIFPVIEVPAGREVSVVFLEGVDLSAGTSNRGGVSERGIEPIVTKESQELIKTNTRSRIRN